MVLHFMWKNYFLMHRIYHLKILEILDISLTDISSFSVLFFPLFWTPCSSLCTAFGAVWHRYVSLSQLLCLWIWFWRLHENMHKKEWLTYSGKTDRPGKFFIMLNDLTQNVNFSNWCLGLLFLYPSLFKFISIFWP